VRAKLLAVPLEIGPTKGACQCSLRNGRWGLLGWDPKELVVFSICLDLCRVVVGMFSSMVGDWRVPGTVVWSALIFFRLWKEVIGTGTWYHGTRYLVPGSNKVTNAKNKASGSDRHFSMLCRTTGYCDHSCTSSTTELLASARAISTARGQHSFYRLLLWTETTHTIHTLCLQRVYDYSTIVRSSTW